MDSYAIKPVRLQVYKRTHALDVVLVRLIIQVIRVTTHAMQLFIITCI